MSSDNKKDNIKYIGDYIDKDKTKADKLVNAIILGSGILSGHLTYKIIRNALRDICYILNLKSTGSRIIAFSTGYGVAAGTIYKLNELYSIIKEVSDGRG